MVEEEHDVPPVPLHLGQDMNNPGHVPLDVEDALPLGPQLPPSIDIPPEGKF